VRSVADWRDLLGKVDCVSVCSPAVTHAEIVRAFLDAGAHVLVEKPIATDLDEADELIALAEANDRVLTVGHQERFVFARTGLLEFPDAPREIACWRLGPWTGRGADVSVVLDLMIHDLDLLIDLIGEPVVEVHALGMTVFGKHEDMASARLRFAGGCVAHLTASRMSPRPKRKMRIWAPEGYAGIDYCDKRLTLVQPSAELRTYGLNARAVAPEQRRELQQQVFTRHLQTQELTCDAPSDQLTAELAEFVRCVALDTVPRVPGAAGRDAIALAERIVAELRRHAWNNDVDGPIGPDEIPLPAGWLFDPPTDALIDRAAA